MPSPLLRMRVLQLADQLRDAGRVVRQPGRARELARVDRRIAGEEFAQHVAEFVVVVLVRIIGHRLAFRIGNLSGAESTLARDSAKQDGNWPRLRGWVSARREHQEGTGVALFTDDDLRPDSGEPPERIRPKRSVIVGWSFVGAAFVLTLVLALVPAPYVIEQPGPVFNTLGTDQAVGGPPSKDREAPHHDPEQDDVPDGRIARPAHGLPRRKPRFAARAGSRSPPHGSTPSKAVLPVDAVFPPGTTTEQSEPGERPGDGRLPAGRDRGRPQ